MGRNDGWHGWHGWYGWWWYAGNVWYAWHEWWRWWWFSRWLSWWLSRTINVFCVCVVCKRVRRAAYRLCEERRIYFVLRKIYIGIKFLVNTHDRGDNKQKS